MRTMRAMKPRFEVSTEGMRALQSGRKPWQLAKELVSNAWDETTTTCEVELKSISPHKAKLVVRDDGAGFTNIDDAWTLMGHTPKRLNPTVRGRFNIGEKEILSVADEATIRTAGKIIRFPKNGGRLVRVDKHPFEGTEFICTLPWGPRQVGYTVEKLGQLLVPQGMRYQVNGQVFIWREPEHIIEAILETVLQDAYDKPMRTTRRRTAVELIPAEKGRLYEMGIPIQAIECPYLVNIMQKVPMPPNRDVVRDSYLQDVYATVLNATAPEIVDSSATWVRAAVEDKDAEPEAVKEVMRNRYGENVALWSSDPHANEKALRAGFELVHARTLSLGERQAFANVGLAHSSTIFPTSVATPEDIPKDKWTQGMADIAGYSRRLAKELLGIDIYVSFYSNMRIGGAGNYGNGHFSFNIAKLGYKWFDSIRPDVTGFILHELSHQEADGHQFNFYNSLEKLSGKAVHLALEHPEVFGNNHKGG